MPFRRGQPPTTRVSDDEILEHLRMAYHEIGQRLNAYGYEVWAVARRQGGTRTPSRDVVIHRFGSWRAACQAAGIPYREGRGISVADALGWLRQAADDVGEPVTPRRFNAWRRQQRDRGVLAPRLRVLVGPGHTELDDQPITKADVRRHFGVSNTKPKRGRSRHPSWIPDDEILDHIRSAYRDVGVRLHAFAYETWARAHREGFRSRRPASSSTVIARFGSWANACAAASVPYREPGGLDLDEAIVWLARAAEDLGGPLTVGDYNRWRRRQRDRGVLPPLLATLVGPDNTQHRNRVIMAEMIHRHFARTATR